MVNTGKPSRGCYMCRARRIKCDEAKPSCMRCHKSKRVCPGYRDTFELKLREESKATRKKASRQSNPVLGPFERTFSQELFLESRGDMINYPTYVPPVNVHRRNKSESCVQSEDFMYDFMGAGSNPQVHRNHHALIYHMTTPIHQQAACYFFANFVLMPQSTGRGHFDFILPLLKQDMPSRPLIHAFSAAALAALGTRPNSKALIPQANLWYLEALKEINMTLKDPNVANSDSTLAAVMLLACFEQLVPSKNRVGGWTSHIDGAVAMIKTRPLATWQFPAFRDIFISVRSHMTIHCIASSRSTDTSINWLSVSTNDPTEDMFAQMNLKMAQLRADNDRITLLANHSTKNLEKVLKLLRRAKALEKEYVRWLNNLPPLWAMQTVAWIEPNIDESLSTSPIHPGKILAYRDMWIAYHYNVVRACRLCIWTVILRCVAWMNNPRDYRLSPEYSIASAVCRQIIEDMVSSVPYFFGWKRDVEPAMAAQSTYACGSENTMDVKGLAGVFVMWPVFIAATSDFASPSQRIYLRGRLQFISEHMGINQAGIMLQAQLMHPSLYIAHEKQHLAAPDKLDISISTFEDDEMAIINGGMQTAVMQAQRPTLQGNWIPRSFKRTEMEEVDMDMDIKMEISLSSELTGDIIDPMDWSPIVVGSGSGIGDYGGYNNFEHELASYDMAEMMMG